MNVYYTFLSHYIPSYPQLSIYIGIKCMQDRKAVNKIYQSENISIRKNIRELDMGYDNFLSSNSVVQNLKRPDVNILVVGSVGSGKTSLARTMHYALNSNLSCYIENRIAANTCFDRFEIKKNKRCTIEGLSKMKQTDEKLGVYAYEINFSIMGNQFSSPINRYSRCVEFINNKTLGCIQYSNTSITGINYVIICLNMLESLKKQELAALKIFITQLEESKVKFNIVGTHLDRIINQQSLDASFASYSSLGSKCEQQRIIYVDEWKKRLQSELGLKTNIQVYCMSNYEGINNKKQGFENSESINFYALTLLHNCIKRAPQTDKYKKNGYKLFCF